MERSSEDPDTLIITYEGLHLHFAYPYFFVNQTEQVSPPLKKTKRPTLESEFEAHETQQIPEEAQDCPAHAAGSAPVASSLDDYSQQSGLEFEAMGPQGLLEDVVPFMIRNPSINNVSSSSSYSSCRSPPTSPSSLSWSPNHSHPCFDVGINTSIR